MRLGALLGSAGLAMAALLAMPSPAQAAWDAEADASAGAVATRMPTGLFPASRAHGSAVTVDWSAVDIAPGVPVRGYRIVRTNGATGRTTAAGGACSGVVTRTRCVESGAPAGNWKYGVSALLGDNWSSAVEYGFATRLGTVTTAPLQAQPAPSPTLSSSPTTSPASPPAASPSSPAASPSESPAPSAPMPSTPPSPLPSAPGPSASPSPSPSASGPSAPPMPSPSSPATSLPLPLSSPPLLL